MYNDSTTSLAPTTSPNNFITTPLFLKVSDVPTPADVANLAPANPTPRAEPVAAAAVGTAPMPSPALAAAPPPPPPLPPPLPPPPDVLLRWIRGGATGEDGPAVTQRVVGAAAGVVVAVTGMTGAAAAAAPMGAPLFRLLPPGGVLPVPRPPLAPPSADEKCGKLLLLLLLLLLANVPVAGDDGAIFADPGGFECSALAAPGTIAV